MAKLIELIANVDQMDAEDVIFAKRDWQQQHHAREKNHPRPIGPRFEPPKQSKRVHGRYEWNEDRRRPAKRSDQWRREQIAERTDALLDADALAHELERERRERPAEEYGEQEERDPEDLASE